MSVSVSSVRARLFLVVSGMAALAVLTIAIGYLATNAERVDIQADARIIRDLYGDTAQLAGAVRDQEAAVDDYLLSSDAEALNRYRAALGDEARLTERISLQSSLVPEVPKLGTATATLSQATDTWRRTFAEPAISAVAHGSATEIAAFAKRVARDQDPSEAGIADLLGQLQAAQVDVGAREEALSRTREVSGVVGGAVMLLGALASLFLVRRWITRPLARLVGTATIVQRGGVTPFVVERDDEIGQLGHALERMRLALQGDAERSTVLNRFTEVTTFAADDTAVAAANLEALSLLVQPDSAVTHVLNRSKDRAIPEATLGKAVAQVLPLNMLSSCPGIVRGSIFVTPDVSAPLSVRCPIFPVDQGTVACIPLAHGETVGAVHLAWDRTNAFPLEERASVARVAEHAALAIGNRRLLAALQGMASTDARTGLANTRRFDQVVEEELLARGEGEELALLMLDLDHFKDFNDRYGHPAGDEALRAFADILRSCLREGDVAARYGGEEFAVLLPKVDQATAMAVAERIRSRTESTLISLAPGITDRISVSIGVSTAPAEATDRVTLLRLADEALYRAKEGGRNRVEFGLRADTAAGRATRATKRRPGSKTA